VKLESVDLANQPAFGFATKRQNWSSATQASFEPFRDCIGLAAAMPPVDAALFRGKQREQAI
jgi:hypothetical protein